MSSSEEIIWQPSKKQIEQAEITKYQQWLENKYQVPQGSYESLWQWSVQNLESFWASIWEYFDIQASEPYTEVLSSEVIPEAKWFAGAKLNIAEQLFRFHQQEPDRPAIYSQSELRPLSMMTWGELKEQVMSVAASLRDLGVEAGDRVVAYMPNIPETTVAFYACASIGAIWSSCSPDMGTHSVIDRFSQIAPKVLLAVDGYRYGGKDFSRLSVLAEMQKRLPTLEHTVLLPYLNENSTLEDSVPWDTLLHREASTTFTQVPFDHPLWVVYSSGTTGMPKPIVHGHGGALLESVKSAVLHFDVGPEDRFMWYSTTGWIMWNSQVTALLTGASITLYDGNPGYPNLEVLWQLAEATEVTFFGGGAAYFMGCKKAGLIPKEKFSLPHLRAIGSTGSPLPTEDYHWIHEAVGEDIFIAAISGGTDIAAAFVGSCPTLPIVAGEMQCRGLGIAVYAFDEAGNAVEDEVGELVVTKPMPSMPLYFWNDHNGERYHESYFTMYPNYWRHGDWLRITPRGGAIIYGRSDTTINRHGIRMGTSEIYRVVEGFSEVLDSLVVDLEYLGRPSFMPLFLVLHEGIAFSTALADSIKQAIREQLSARHVPNDVYVVPSIPRTMSGKKMELPIRRLLLGAKLEDVANVDAMANPEAMDWFVQFAATLNN